MPDDTLLNSWHEKWEAAQAAGSTLSAAGAIKLRTLDVIRGVRHPNLLTVFATGRWGPSWSS